MPSRKNRVRLRFRSLRADWQKHELLTQKIIGIFYPIYNELGHGFLENVYQKSFAVLVREQALNYCAQMPIKIFYHNVDVGEYFADLVPKPLAVDPSKIRVHPWSFRAIRARLWCCFWAPLT